MLDLRLSLSVCNERMKLWFDDSDSSLPTVCNRIHAHIQQSSPHEITKIEKSGESFSSSYFIASNEMRDRNVFCRMNPWTVNKERIRIKSIHSLHEYKFTES